MRVSLSDHAAVHEKSARLSKGVDNIDSCILKIAHVACYQYSTERAGNGGDLAVCHSYQPVDKFGVRTGIVAAAW